MKNEPSITALLTLIVAGLLTHGGSASDQRPERRPVTVRDSIELTTFEAVDFRGRVAQFSPDGRFFVVLTARGDTTQNARRFSLLLFRTASAVDRPDYETLLAMSSRTTEDAIQDVRWFDDDTITFIGAQGDAPSQVFVLDRRTREIRKLTQHTTPVLSYAVDRDMHRVLYSAASGPSVDAEDLAAIRDHGLVITYQQLADLIAGDYFNHHPGFDQGVMRAGHSSTLFIRHVDSGQVRAVERARDEELSLPRQVYRFSPNPISPDGRFAVVTRSARMPERWRAYVPLAGKAWAHTAVPSLALVDMETGATRQLLDAPSNISVSAAWLPKGHRVIAGDTFLPLAAPDRAEHARRQRRTAVVDVDVDTGEVSRLRDQASGSTRVLGWDTRNAAVALEVKASSEGDNETQAALLFFRPNGSGWRELGIRLDADQHAWSAPNANLTLSIHQDINTPPVLVATDRNSGRRSVLIDPNPQLRELELAHVSLIHWTAGDGHRWDGNLYLPRSHRPGVRYPLVIQTGGCAVDDFSIDGAGGPSPARLAQPLASQGIVVLSVGQCVEPAAERSLAKLYGGPQWAPAYQEGFESAIDELYRHGLIDPTRVGIAGFSSPGWTVDYAITHPDPKYPLAAAASADEMDLNYMTYLAYPSFRGVVRTVAGAEPLYDELDRFRKATTAMNAGRVSTPLRMEVQSGARALLAHWELYAALKAHDKPVEMILFLDAHHTPVRPSHRMASHQGMLDWFRFWLKGEEDRDPAKAAQYVRWRELRRQRDANQKSQE